MKDIFLDKGYSIVYCF